MVFKKLQPTLVLTKIINIGTSSVYTMNPSHQNTMTTRTDKQTLKIPLIIK